MADESKTTKAFALPLSNEEADELLGPLAGRPIALAVSGGGDSTALLLLVAEWFARHGSERSGPAPIVLTVDHGLRSASADEATKVAALTARFGLSHTTLHWTGPRPGRGLMAAARNARYRLAHAHLAEEAATRHTSPRALVTAHTADDRAETLLMRLARGSGITGLGSERAETSLVVLDGEGQPTGARLTVSRPLLGVPRARLRATLRARNIDWIDDPTNAAEAFERPRVRRVLALLAPLGVTGAALSRSADRLERADRALAAITTEWVDRHVAWPAGAFASLAFRPLLAAPEEIAVRALALVLARQGGDRNGPSQLAEAEFVSARLAALRDGPLTAATVAGTVVEVRKHGGREVGAEGLRLDIFREPGRRGLPSVELGPGQSIIWDGRFRIHCGSGLTGPLVVRAMTPAEWTDASARHGRDRPLDRPPDRRSESTPPPRRSLLPPRARATVPSIWRGAELLAAPHAGLGRLYGASEPLYPGLREVAIGVAH